MDKLLFGRLPKLFELNIDSDKENLIQALSTFEGIASTKMDEDIIKPNLNKSVNSVLIDM